MVLKITRDELPVEWVCMGDAFSVPFILSWFQPIFVALCLVTTIFAYTKIFLSLLQNQIRVQNYVAQRQSSQPISLSIARYRKAVYSALWVQGTLGICYTVITRV